MVRRKELNLKFEAQTWVTRFRHPLTGRVVRFNLGADQSTAKVKCKLLSAVFQDPSRWHGADFGPHEDLQRMWTGKATRAGIDAKNNPTLNGKPVDVDPADTAGLHAQIENMQREYDALEAAYDKLRRDYEQRLGRKARVGPSPTLQDALDTWKKGYVDGFFPSGGLVFRRFDLRERSDLFFCLWKFVFVYPGIQIFDYGSTSDQFVRVIPFHVPFLLAVLFESFSTTTAKRGTLTGSTSATMPR